MLHKIKLRFQLTKNNVVNKSHSRFDLSFKNATVKKIQFILCDFQSSNSNSREAAIE